MDHARDDCAVCNGIANGEMLSVALARLAAIARAIDRKNFVGDVRDVARGAGEDTLLMPGDGQLTSPDGSDDQRREKNQRRSGQK